MILRKLADAIRTQNWFTVFIEFTLVVAGVLVALQFDNWNEERIEREKQQVYLLRLNNDFQGLRQRLDRHIKYYSTANEACLYIQSIINAEPGNQLTALIDPDRLEHAFDAISSPRITPSAPATYVEMLSEGQLSRMRPTELRDKLAEHDRLLSVVEEVGRVVINQYIQQEPILYRHVSFVSVPNDSNLTGTKRALRSYDIQGMRSDKEFATAVALTQSNALNTLAQRKFQLQLISDILKILDREIK